MTRVRSLASIALVTLAACGAPPPPAAPPPPPPAAPPPPPPPPPPRELAVGPLVVTLSTSTTAQVFHVVDCLSAWGPAAKRSPYRKWAETALPLDDAERAMLAEHAKLRRRRGWGALDQAFVVDASIADAADRAVSDKHLSRADADRERALLEHFAPRLAPLLDAQKANVDALVARARDEIPRAAPLGAKVARFLGVEDRIELPVFLASDPSPTRAAGALHGGRLVVEVLAPGDAGDGGEGAPRIDAGATFFHELFHALLVHKRESIAIGAAKCDEAVDEETMSEGLAYAIAPGLWHADGDDVLPRMVAADRDLKLRAPMVRFERLGLALRDPLREALDRGDTLHAFFPEACDRWASVAKNQR